MAPRLSAYDWSSSSRASGLLEDGPEIRRQQNKHGVPSQREMFRRTILQAPPALLRAFPIASDRCGVRSTRIIPGEGLMKGAVIVLALLSLVSTAAAQSSGAIRRGRTCAAGRRCGGGGARGARGAD
jgi:hypothetical protein